jgi:hypothetical protein
LRYNTIAVVYIVIIILIAQAVAPGSYVWRNNTISQLAAQRYAQAWIMRAGFIGFGALVALGAVRRYRAQPSRAYRDWPLLLYGLGMALAGVFSARSWVDAVAYSPGEAGLHSLMATLAGVGISLAALLSWIRDPGPRRDVWHLVAFALMMLLSALFGMVTRGAGVVQRCLYIVGFAWLVYIELRQA